MSPAKRMNRSFAADLCVPKEPWLFTELHIGGAWRRWWIHLFGDDDAGCRHHYCRNLFIIYDRWYDGCTGLELATLNRSVCSLNLHHCTSSSSSSSLTHSPSLARLLAPAPAPRLSVRVDSSNAITRRRRLREYRSPSSIRWSCDVVADDDLM